jgi:hypothetical protein
VDKIRVDAVIRRLLESLVYTFLQIYASVRQEKPHKPSGSRFQAESSRKGLSVSWELRIWGFTNSKDVDKPGSDPNSTAVLGTPDPSLTEYKYSRD